MNIYFQLFSREIRVALKRWTDALTGFILFFLIAILFPLISDSNKEFLLTIVGPIMMFSAFFASMLSMQNMFKPDFQNGTIEQLMLSKGSFVSLILTKTIAYWLFTSLPLILISGLTASIYFVSASGILIIQLTLLLSTLTMVHINAFTAAITLGIRYPGALMTLIITPITLPILIFGSKTIENSILGADISGPLYFLTGMMMLSFFLGPWITASALKISMD